MAVNKINFNQNYFRSSNHVLSTSIWVDRQKVRVFKIKFVWRIRFMGTICAHPMEKDECNETVETNRKNLVQLHGTLANSISVDLILGHYRQCRGESLLVIIEAKNLQHCDPLKDYTNDCFKTIEMIQNMRKTFFKPTINKNCPYKKLFLCMMPNYKSEEGDEYKQLFSNVFKEAIQGVKEITVEFINTIEGVHTLPNQLIMGLMLKDLTNTRPNLKLNLITAQKKMMSFYRYQLLKTEKFVIGQIKE